MREAKTDFGVLEIEAVSVAVEGLVMMKQREILEAQRINQTYHSISSKPFLPSSVPISAQKLRDIGSDWKDVPLGGRGGANEMVELIIMGEVTSSAMAQQGKATRGGNALGKSFLST